MKSENLATADIRVVGTGSIGRQYLSCLPMGSSGRRIAVSASGRGTIAHEFSCIDQEDFVTRDRIPVDLCVIATRTRNHVRDAMEFAPSSRRLLVEKPLAGSLSEAMVLASAEALLTKDVTVASPLRFMTGFRESRRLLATLGNLVRVEITCQSWLPDWRPGSDYRASYSTTAGEGGVLLDLIHEVDYAVALFGLPETVSAELSEEPTLGIPVESHADITWKYANFDLKLRLSFGSKRPVRSLVVEGAGGILEWNLLEGKTSLQREPQGPLTVRYFPKDLDRPSLLRSQLEAALGGHVGESPATLANGLMALHLVDLARASHRSASRELEVSGIVSFAHIGR